MSGTSLDGIDAVIARLSGSGRELDIETLASTHIPFSDALRALLLRNSAPDTSSVFDLSQLNVRLAHAYAGAVREVAAAAGLPVTALDLVGCHGQTVHHIPEATDCAGEPVISTLQIGDPSVLANLLGVPVVGDFRVADMALGGQGAPLVPYLDYVLFADAGETRGLLNLGGIANLTVLPAGGGAETVIAFDTGPADMVVDALAQRFFGLPYDDGGALARQGTIRTEVVAQLLDDAFFLQPPPRSTGRERFGAPFVDRLIQLHTEYGSHGAHDFGASSPDPHDLLATATMLTVASIYQAYARFLRTAHPLDVLIVSGGGLHNDFLMQKLADSFAPIPVRPIHDYGVDADAKEALCFAVLAHETMNGVPTNLPSVTGASRPAVLGKICMV